MATKDWEAILAREGMPRELPRIPRRLSRGREATWEGDTDQAALDAPPFPPTVRRPGRPQPVEASEYRELAQDLLLHGGLEGVQLEVWMAYCAGMSEAVIAVRVGRSRRWLTDHVLGPLKLRAGIPAPWFQEIKKGHKFAPRKRRSGP